MLALLAWCHTAVPVDVVASGVTFVMLGCSNLSEFAAGQDDQAQVAAAAPQPEAMEHKNDLIVWLQLHPAQRHVYEASHHLVRPLGCLPES